LQPIGFAELFQIAQQMSTVFDETLPDDFALPKYATNRRSTTGIRIFMEFALPSDLQAVPYSEIYDQL
jgi:hypothetical protein